MYGVTSETLSHRTYRTQAGSCICSQPFHWYFTDLVRLASACCDTLNPASKPWNRSCASSAVLRCPSQCRHLALFYFLHFSVTTLWVLAAMGTQGVLAAALGWAGLPWVHVPCAGCCTRMQGWSSPHSASEDDLYKIHINAEKHWGFAFTSLTLPLDLLVYKAFGDWRCPALFCALQQHLCFYCCPSRWFEARLGTPPRATNTLPSFCGRAHISVPAQLSPAASQRSRPKTLTRAALRAGA